MVTSCVIEAPVARIYVDTPVFTEEVLALCLAETICDLLIGNIPGVHPNIFGDVVNSEEEVMQQEEVGRPQMRRCSSRW